MAIDSYEKANNCMMLEFIKENFPGA
jgi:hypothetical protein